MNGFEFKEIRAKSILTPSKLPDADYVINPYIGCRFGCIYCYASFMGRFVDKSTHDWGNYVFAKVNAPELLSQEITKLKDQGAGKTVFISSVTDPYQGMEAKYQLTRKCLRILADQNFAGKIGVLTKSDLVIRDIDIFLMLKNVEVGLTITSTDDLVSRYFEKHAPFVSARLAALAKLNQAGITTYAFLGPLLPHYIAEEEKLDELLGKIALTGTKELYVEHINLNKYIRERFVAELGEVDRSLVQKFYSSQSKPYREELNKLVTSLVKKHGLALRLGEAIFHGDNGKK
ncbi:MAG: SPL family radical SAM protein [Patescibacteria group bacterium]